ncbi:small nuclear ribonucleoprotein E, partial [Egretta garzetta]|uniref:small nuclear ribonucleoprotein E n=1 Tax=Egretta garzetta TaxID=188379 RepID=UPI00163BAD79
WTGGVRGKQAGRSCRAGRGGAEGPRGRVAEDLLPCCVLNAPLQNLIFRYLQNRSRIQVWLYEQVNMRIEGCIIGFDEYMNLVLDDAEEIHSKTKSRKQLGRIMLKGDNITLLQSVSN